MCGIAGWAGAWDPGRDEADRVLRRMTDALAHRGPDDAGYDVAAGVGLGHRRLAIIDLSPGGHQPMWSADRTRAIVFNGEIYNFRLLRRELEAKGRRFTSQSDTEVLLALWDEEGEAMLPRLNGMFALAIWDARSRSLFAARDRMGKKPFHYAAKDGTLVFGSEIKALLAHPVVGKRLDRDAIVRYLAFDYVPAPRSIFADVAKLPGGHALAFAGGKLRTWAWWHCPFAAEEPEVDEEQAAREIGSLLTDAVRERLVSDVPLGVFLSGGIDSSSIVAAMAESVPGKDIRTFSIAFNESKYDESDYARAVAARYGTTHHEDRLDAARMLEILPEILDRLDEPFADPSLVPTHLLCGLVRKHVTVALGGDGGDELFAGYPLSPYTRMTPRAGGWLPRGTADALAAAAQRMPAWLRWRKAGYKLGKILAALPRSDAARQHLWMSSFYPAMQGALWLADGAAAAESVYDDFERTAAECPSADAMQRSLWVFYRSWLQDDILAKVDRASMMHALEVRAPYLDPRLVDHASRLPYRLKMRGKRTKIVLKRALRGKVPDAILDRPKKGFGVPLGAWFKGPLKERLRSTLGPERIREGGLFRPDVVHRMVEDHVTGRGDWRKPLWTLFVFEEWRRRYA